MKRSLLFIPGNNPAMLQSAEVFEADGVIIDLEDAVIVDAKDSARELVYNFLNTYKIERSEVIIRVNGLDTEFGAVDMEKIVTDHIDSIMLPKAGIEEVLEASALLAKIEKEKKLKKTIKIIPIIELAKSVLQIEQIVACERVSGVLLGAEDLTSDLQVQRTEEGDEIFYARVKVIMACKAYKKDAIDTPYTNTRNDEGLKADCVKAKMLGMSAKACIHPNQVEVVNELLAPSQKEINYALRVLAAVEEAKVQQKGAFSIDGKMIDKPIIMRAETTLMKAKKFNLM